MNKKRAENFVKRGPNKKSGYPFLNVHLRRRGGRSKWLNRFNHDNLKLQITLFSCGFRFFGNVLWWRPLTPIWNFQFQFSQLSQQSVLAAWLKTCTLIKHKKYMFFFILWVNDDSFLMAAGSRKMHFKLISKFLCRCHGNINLT